jgi:predicted enzyme related to lactoylglutathione lyase
MGAPIVHLEFKSADFERTAAFYAKLFDWRTEKNASSSYMKLDSTDGPSGGWVRADLVQAPGPIAYLTVDDLAGKLAEVEAAGGRVLVRSLPFAGGGEVGLFADPDGNVLGLWRRKVAAPGAAGVDGKPAAAKAGDGKPVEVKAAPAKAAVKPAAKAGARSPAKPKKK